MSTYLHPMKASALVVMVMATVSFGQRSTTNDGIKIKRLPEAKANKTISLNPEYCVHGEPKAGFKSKLPLLIYLHGAGGVGLDIGKPAKLFVLEDKGHDAGRVPYSQPEFFKWLFSHKRKK